MGEFAWCVCVSLSVWVSAFWCVWSTPPHSVHPFQCDRYHPIFMEQARFQEILSNLRITVPEKWLGKVDHFELVRGFESNTCSLMQTLWPERERGPWWWECFSSSADNLCPSRKLRKTAENGCPRFVPLYSDCFVCFELISWNQQGRAGRPSHQHNLCHSFHKSCQGSKRYLLTVFSICLLPFFAFFVH
jgi:hypothetical protein